MLKLLNAALHSITPSPPAICNAARNTLVQMIRTWLTQQQKQPLLCTKAHALLLPNGTSLDYSYKTTPPSTPHRSAIQTFLAYKLIKYYNIHYLNNINNIYSLSLSQHTIIVSPCSPSAPKRLRTPLGFAAPAEATPH